jgi:putative endonuclease
MAGLVPAIHVLEDSRMKSAWVYIMTNRANGTLYVGVTNDLVRRVGEHRTGVIPGFTKRYGLKKLVYFEEHQNVELAIQREHNMKHWSRTWKVRLILRDNPEWRDLFPEIAA